MSFFSMELNLPPTRTQIEITFRKYGRGDAVIVVTVELLTVHFMSLEV